MPGGIQRRRPPHMAESDSRPCFIGDLRTATDRPGVLRQIAGRIMPGYDSQTPALSHRKDHAADGRRQAGWQVPGHFREQIRSAPAEAPVQGNPAGSIRAVQRRRRYLSITAEPRDIAGGRAAMGSQTGKRPPAGFQVSRDAPETRSGIRAAHRQARRAADGRGRRCDAAEREPAPQRQSLPEPGLEVPQDHPEPAPVYRHVSGPAGGRPVQALSIYGPGGGAGFPPVFPGQGQPASAAALSSTPGSPQDHLRLQLRFPAGLPRQPVGDKRKERRQQLRLAEAETVDQGQFSGRQDIPLVFPPIQQGGDLITGKQAAGKQTAPRELVDPKRMGQEMFQPFHLRNIQGLDFRFTDEDAEVLFLRPAGPEKSRQQTQ